MIPFKGRIFFRQYIPRKPHSTGIKYWALVDEEGYLYYFQIYVGKKRQGKKKKDQGEKMLVFHVLEAMNASVCNILIQICNKI